MSKGMLSLELKTKIDLYYSSWMVGRGIIFNYYIPLLLKDGAILLYDQNTILLLSKSLYKEILFSFEKNKEEKEISIIRNIKQIECGDILCCNKKLYIFNIKSKTKTPKIINIPNDENLCDIIELRNKQLLGITKNSIIEIKKIWNNYKKEEEYELNIIFKIPEKYIEMPQDENEKKNNTYIQYLNIYELSNKRLLIHSYSTQLIYGTCGTHPPGEFCRNKIFIFDLNIKEITHYFQTIYDEVNIIILEKYICISYSNIVDIYDITNNKLLKTIKDKFSKNYIIKYNENIIIGLGEEENNNDIIIYNLLDINDIKYFIFTGKFMKFEEMKYNSVYTVRRVKNKTICLLNNNFIFIACHGRAFIVEMKENINCINFHPLKEIEYSKEEIEEMENIEYVYI